MSHVTTLESQLPGLMMTGNWRAGISVADTVAHGKSVAKRLGKHLYP